MECIKCDKEMPEGWEPSDDHWLPLHDEYLRPIVNLPHEEFMVEAQRLWDKYAESEAISGS